MGPATPEVANARCTILALAKRFGPGVEFAGESDIFTTRIPRGKHAAFIDFMDNVKAYYKSRGLSSYMTRE